MPRIGHKAAAFSVLILGLGLGACESTKRQLGIVQDAPDEFTVVTKAPLVMPPDRRALPRPQPGVRGRGEIAAQDQAARALYGSGQAPARASAGEAALLSAAGAQNASSGVRAEIDRETDQIDAESGYLLDQILGNRRGDRSATVVDPNAEAARIQTRARGGGQVTGEDTPVIQPKSDSLF